jgi:hypothetical protein
MRFFFQYFLLNKQNRGQRRIEEFEDSLQNEETKKEEARKKMEYTNKLLVKVKSDIEHLANKLHNLKAVHTKSQFKKNQKKNFIFFILFHRPKVK